MELPCTSSRDITVGGGQKQQSNARTQTSAGLGWAGLGWAGLTETELHSRQVGVLTVDTR